jgi:hypothetical protein
MSGSPFPLQLLNLFVKEGELHPCGATGFHFLHGLPASAIEIGFAS